MQIITPSNTIVEGDPTLSAARVSCRYSESTGRYLLSARSGLIAAPAANTVLFSMYWNHNTLLAAIDWFRLVIMNPTPPTVAQEFGFYTIQYRNITSPVTAGTKYSPLTVSKRWSQDRFSAGIDVDNASNFTLIAIPGTAALALPTGNSDVSAWLSESAWELAAGAAVPRAKIDAYRNFSGGIESPLYLSLREAISVNNLVAYATGTMRINVELEWHEVDPSEI